VSKRANVEIPPCGCEAPGANAAATCYCGVDDLLRVIRRRYSLAAMNAIHSRGTARYNDIAAALPGVSSSTLSETLAALERAELVRRVDLTRESPHVEYSLTKSGEKLLNRLRRLLDDVNRTGHFG
jgi:DNA-binding HxlR family transcriptional regulator